MRLTDAFAPCVSAFRAATRSQERPGGARRSQEEPGGLQELWLVRLPGAARRSQEEPGAARRSQEEQQEPGRARSQEESGGAWRSQEDGSSWFLQAPPCGYRTTLIGSSWMKHLSTYHIAIMTIHRSRPHNHENRTHKKKSPKISLRFRPITGVGERSGTARDWPGTRRTPIFTGPGPLSRDSLRRTQEDQGVPRRT